MPTENQISDLDREMLKSILKNDNERLENKIAGTSAETVFVMNWEGGGMEISRYTTADGKQYFRTSGGGMGLDENDDEVWDYREGDPASSFEEVLFFIGFGKDILGLRPSRVHPEYRDRIREHINTLLGEVNSDDRLRFGDRLPETADEWFDRLK